MLRMLRARKFDVDAAATLTQEILAYRAEHGLDGLLQVFFFNLLRYLLPSPPLFWRNTCAAPAPCHPRGLSP